MIDSLVERNRGTSTATVMPMETVEMFRFSFLPRGGWSRVCVRTLRKCWMCGENNGKVGTRFKRIGDNIGVETKTVCTFDVGAWRPAR